MKYFTCFVLAVALGSTSMNAQDSTRFFISAVSDFDFGSDRLPLSFAADFYRGEYLDSASKTDALISLGRRNVTGYLTMSSITAGIDANSQQNGWFVRAEYSSMATIRYSSSLFQLAFFGNSYLAGDTVKLNPFSLNASSWFFIPAGIIFRTGKDKKLQWMVGVGPVAASNYMSVEADRLKLFTANDGSYIDIDMAWDYQRTPSYPQFKGYGGAVYMRLSSPETAGMPEWYIAATSPAYVHFNNKSIYSSRDTALHFSGAEIDDISMIDNEIQSTFDALEDDFSFKGDTASFAAWLPASIEAGFKGNYGKIDWAFNTHVVAIDGYMPMLRLSIGYPVSNNFHLILPVRYGGFGGFNTGIGCALNFPSGFYAGIYADQLLSLVFPDNFSACGFALSIGFKN